jgi:hypothetical protein
MGGFPSSESAAVADRLADLAAVIDGLDDVTYLTARKDGVSGSIGAHVRHTIDHVAALVEPTSPGLIDYDSRRRGTEIERSRRAAVRELRRLAVSLRQISKARSIRLVMVDAVIDPSGRRVRSISTVGRELIFVLSHTVHHQAIVSLLLAQSGRLLPERFGLAPSTPSRPPCAQSA